MATATASPIETLREKWRGEVATRRARTNADPLADVLASCADELDAALRASVKTELTPAEFAARHGKSEETVRRWCRDGDIRSRRSGREWLIPVEETPPTFTRDDATGVSGAADA